MRKIELFVKKESRNLSSSLSINRRLAALLSRIRKRSDMKPRGQMDQGHRFD